MANLTWVLVYKVAEVGGVAAAVALLLFSAGGIDPLHVVAWSLGIGLVVVVVDELIGGVTPRVPDN
jgi:hypothetical protein